MNLKRPQIDSLTVLCPGMHDPQLSDRCLASLARQRGEPFSVLAFPAPAEPPYSPWHVWQFLQHNRHQCQDRPLIFLGFSAGVAGAIGAAWMWQWGGGQVRAFLALDGWGVPLGGAFPIHRLSHDEWTHWSSALLGEGGEGFFADPPTDHLRLWHSPHEVPGWVVDPPSRGGGRKERTTAAAFVAALLVRYGAETLNGGSQSIHQSRN